MPIAGGYSYGRRFWTVLSRLADEGTIFVSVRAEINEFGKENKMYDTMTEAKINCDVCWHTVRHGKKQLLSRSFPQEKRAYQDTQYLVRS